LEEMLCCLDGCLDVDVEAAEARTAARFEARNVIKTVEPISRSQAPTTSRTTKQEPFQLRSYDSSLTFITTLLRASSKLGFQSSHLLLDEALILAFCGAIAPKEQWS
jgi:hypothetical protein